MIFSMQNMSYAWWQLAILMKPSFFSSQKTAANWEADEMSKVLIVFIPPPITPVPLGSNMQFCI